MAAIKEILGRWGQGKRGRLWLAGIALLGLVLAGGLGRLIGQYEARAAAATEKLLPVYSVERPDKKIALTFDAAAGAADTDALLGILAVHQAKATFFLCGCWMRNHPEETIRLYGAGHEIGNHGDAHLDPVGLSREKLTEEIEGAAAQMQALLGVRPTLYRPAYGSYNNQVVSTARDMGYKVIQWSVDSLDWKELGLREMQERVLNHKDLGPGAILLFHNDTKYTAQALDQILTELEQRGYEMVTVSELLLEEPTYLDHTGRQWPGERP